MCFHFKGLSLGVIFCAGVLGPLASHAADASPEKKLNPPDSGPKKLTAPNPYPQFLALKEELKSSKVAIDWTGSFNRLAKGGADPAAFKDPEITLCLLIGFRLADGMMAVMAEDSEALRTVAEEVEELADKVGVDRSNLKSANALREAALKGDWGGVVWELGFLQADIMDQLNNGKTVTIDEPKTVVAALGGFLQGMTYASDVVLANFEKKDLSNFLRSGKYIEALQSRVDALPERIKTNEKVALAMEALGLLYPLTNIERDGSIQKGGVTTILETASQAVEKISKP